MEDLEIQEGNKLIAEFYGDISGITSYPDEPFEFHSSWDWLMLAVEKISTLTISSHNYPIIVTIKKDFCLISYQDSIYNQTIVVKTVNRNDGKNTKEVVWLAIVDFIKWYNENYNK
jgi:hypothetical protein